MATAKNKKKNMKGYFSLNLGSLCEAIYDTCPKGLCDPNGKKIINNENSDYKYKIVILVYSLLYTDKELSHLPDRDFNVTFSTASKIIHNINHARDDIRDYAQGDVLDIIQENINSRILSHLTLSTKTALLSRIQTLVAELSDEHDYMNLKKYLGLTFSSQKEASPLISRFLAKCIRFSLLMPNSPGGTVYWERINNQPVLTSKNDPYRLVSDDAGSSAVKIIIKRIGDYRWSDPFYNFDQILATLLRQRAVIKSITFKDGAIYLQYTQLSAIKNLKKLSKKEHITAYEFIQKYEKEFRRKRSWGDRNLCDMVKKGLDSNKWTAYGYFDGEGKLISYLDTKIRLDGGVELGVALTDSAYRGASLSSSLIYLMQLKYAHCRLFGGTYEENNAMHQTFSTTDFVRILYNDHGEKIDKIKERINPECPDEAFDTYSIYFFSESLLTRAFHSSLACKK